MPRVHRHEIAGQRFGRLTAISVTDTRGNWLCSCDCGEEKVISASNLVHGNTKSCGCLSIEAVRKRRLVHGRSGTKEHRAWLSMIDRCTRLKCTYYDRYGGRGITVCERWRHSFTAFLEDIGEAPSPNHSLDRIENDGHYEPGNVCWSDKRKQARNRRNSRVVEFRGERRTVAEWADVVGMDKNLIYYRLNRLGWSVDQALVPPAERKL